MNSEASEGHFGMPLSAILVNYMLKLRYRNGLERTWDHIWHMRIWSMHNSILILLWTFMDNGHGGLFNFRIFRTYTTLRWAQGVAQLVPEVDYLFLATSLPQKLEWPDKYINGASF